MEENKKVIDENTKLDKERESAEAEEQRVKVLSPGQLVLKRFLRNKLAIVGLVILIIMFVFSFICAIFSPYGPNQVFRKYDEVKVDYATAIINNEIRYTLAEGKDFSNIAKAQFMLAKGSGKNVFEYGDEEYCYTEPAPGLYNIGMFNEVASVSSRAGGTVSGDVSDAVKAGYQEAKAAGETFFVVDDTTYVINATSKGTTIGELDPIAVASVIVFDYADREYASLCNEYGFRLAAETAVGNAETSFEYDGVNYSLDVADSEGSHEIEGSVYLNGDVIINVSNILISPTNADQVLSIDFRTKAREAIAENGMTFEFTALNENDEEMQYFATTTNSNIYITSYKSTLLTDTFAAPSKAHVLGTDKSGMDLMTRLMHGGRVSLMVGFVVIFIELFLGIIVGGISGFFGGWVDMVLMRFVDLFNSIPYWPMMIIAGSVMDSLRIGAYMRLFALMFILGILGWTGIARIVRGQILTLREQEFMIACEANGIRTSRRIFKHLVPNVMPILIVQATMGLGSVIITEATLSYLGLGAKYPMASWGTIINASTDMYVMTNYWWMWIPAGFCILITVLGFNFVGDGLRDAFDPKMKR